MKKFILALVALLSSSSTMATISEIPTIDSVYKFDRSTLRVLVSTARRSYPSNTQITVSTSAVLKNKSFDSTGKLISGELVFGFASHVADGDTRNDGVTTNHCLEIDVQNTIAHVLKRESIKEFEIMGLVLKIPHLNDLHNPIACNQFDQVAVD